MTGKTGLPTGGGPVDVFVAETPIRGMFRRAKRMSVDADLEGREISVCAARVKLRCSRPPRPVRARFSHNRIASTVDSLTTVGPAGSRHSIRVAHADAWQSRYRSLGATRRRRRTPLRR